MTTFSKTGGADYSIPLNKQAAVAHLQRTRSVLISAPGILGGNKVMYPEVAISHSEGDINSKVTTNLKMVM